MSNYIWDDLCVFHLHVIRAALLDGSVNQNQSTSNVLSL
jgi:hypothetical protein